MKEYIKSSDLIKEFEEMAKRGTLLARGDVTQEDLLMQIKGTICNVAMKKGYEIKTRSRPKFNPNSFVKRFQS